MDRDRILKRLQSGRVMAEAISFLSAEDRAHGDCARFEKWAIALDYYLADAMEYIQEQIGGDQ